MSRGISSGLWYNQMLALPVNSARPAPLKYLRPVSPAAVISYSHHYASYHLNIEYHLLNNGICNVHLLIYRRYRTYLFRIDI